MSREIKFRAWDKREEVMIPWDRDFFSDMSPVTRFDGEFPDEDDEIILLQYTGLKDSEGKEYCHKDIGQFDNGDRFIIECEDWLEFFVKWIGEPECEDQARDFYRIEVATIIGNAYENPELLKGEKE